ncbi:MAG: ADP-ribosylglycohydrolase family protein [Merdibacter sp.]|nr:ADP-ribosylglycohydrolase family protein [Merdibacter sp.]
MNKEYVKNKVLGSLICAAVGDSIGAATENLPFKAIREKYNGELRSFVAPDKSAFAYGNEIGEITDDFSQTYLLAKEIVKNNGVIDQTVTEKMLLEWSNIPRWFNRFAGPTTRFAIENIKSKYAGKGEIIRNEVIDYARQATNGAAMKISPAGLFNPCDIDKAIQDACTIAAVTHDNDLAIAGACSTAAAIAYAFNEDATIDGLIKASIYGAEKGEELGRKIRIVGGPNVSERIKLALTIADEPIPKEEKLEKIYNWVGTGLHISEAVPAAIGIIKICAGNALDSTFEAINIGYDTDTIACIVGSIVGAFEGTNGQMLEYMNTIDRANKINIAKLADEMTELIVK